MNKQWSHINNFQTKALLLPVRQKVAGKSLKFKISSCEVELKKNLPEINQTNN